MNKTRKIEMTVELIRILVAVGIALRHRPGYPVPDQ